MIPMNDVLIICNAKAQPQAVLVVVCIDLTVQMVLFAACGSQLFNLLHSSV